MSTEPTCPADGNLLADDGVCGFCGNAPEAFDTTKPDKKLVELAELPRGILDLHRKRSGALADMLEKDAAGQGDA